MASEAFIDKKFTPETQDLIDKINDILYEYDSEGYDLSVRQLYYQLVARGEIPNSQRSYKRIVRVVGDARLTGQIDWMMLVDRVRSTNYAGFWDSPAQIVRSAARGFKLDHWEGQTNHVEVMVEKDALSGVLWPVCRRLDVRFTANRGYSSLSHFYRIGKRLQQAADDGKNVHILYFGDHDPSGLDMDRDIVDRLKMFSASSIYVERLALTMPQVEEMNPPQNPAKTTDSRSDWYISLYGTSSWELDAVEPRALAELVDDEVTALRDDDLYKKVIEREKKMTDDLLRFAATYQYKEDDQ